MIEGLVFCAIVGIMVHGLVGGWVLYRRDNPKKPQDNTELLGNLFWWEAGRMDNHDHHDE